MKEQLWQWRGALITAPIITTIVISIRLLGILQTWEWGALDYFFRFRPREVTDSRIVIVGINENDLKKVRQWPINDRILAKLLKKIRSQYPRSIGLDLYRDLKVEPGYAELVDVFETTPNLIGIELVENNDSENDDSVNAVAPSGTLEKLGQIAANNVIIDADGKLRRGLLYVFKNDQPLESLGLRLSKIYLESEGIEQKTVADNPAMFQLGKATFQPFQTNDGGYVNSDDGGYQVLLNYRGPVSTFKIVSMMDVLENPISEDLFRDKVVLVGATAISLNDFFYTPYSSNNIVTPERTSGVEIQANMISQIISAALEKRKLLQTWPDPLEWWWIFLWSSIGAAVFWKWRYLGGIRNFSVPRMISPFLLIGALFITTYLAFLSGWWLPVVPPFLGLSGSWLVITAYIALTAGDIRRTFGRYLSDEVVANLLESPQGLKLGGERRKVTILTSDLRGFTALSERLQPEEVVQILNIYLKDISEVITKYQGTIDKYMGDGILVLFGAPTFREDDTERAVACALAMQLAMNSINQKITSLGFPKLVMGIGINTGEVVLGNIGSENHTEYSVIGRDVNLAYRIESYTIGGQILISEATYQELKSIVKIDGQKQVLPKGVKQAITIYEIGGISGKYNIFLPQETAILFELPQEIPVKYTLLEGKSLNENEFTGALVKISQKGAEMVSRQRRHDDRPSELTNIKLNLLFEDQTQCSGDIYGKVISSRDNNYIVYIYFTSKTPDAEAQLNFIYNQAKTV